jgi:DNA-binding response OmpR family regulator
LIVDDSAFVGQAVALGLRKAGFEAVVARDLWDLERPDIGRPDLVFMDVVLHEAFGDDLVPLLRDTRQLECPILLFSSLPDAELAARAVEAGCQGYISKRGGIAAIVTRAAELLGNTPAAAATPELGDQLAVSARQSARRILHVAAGEFWNATAIAAEAHALAGDAELAGDSTLAQAARATRDAARAHTTTGPTPEIAAVLAALAAAAKIDPREDVSKILVVDASGFCRDNLYSMLDRAGFVVIEAASLAEARQKIHATRYDLILVDHAVQRDDPSLVPELRAAAPDIRLETLGIQPLAKDLPAERLVVEIRKLVRRHP